LDAATSAFLERVWSLAWDPGRVAVGPPQGVRRPGARHAPGRRCRGVRRGGIAAGTSTRARRGGGRGEGWSGSGLRLARSVTPRLRRSGAWRGARPGGRRTPCGGARDGAATRSELRGSQATVNPDPPQWKRPRRRRTVHRGRV